jgi:hypothetical protein
MRRVITMDYDEEETLGVQRPKRPNKDW